MDAQQMHDEAMRLPTQEELKGSRKRLEALLKRKASSGNAQSSGLGPIARAMRNHPGLTREEAEQMAEEAGF